MNCKNCGHQIIFIEKLDIYHHRFEYIEWDSEGVVYGICNRYEECGCENPELEDSQESD